MKTQFHIILLCLAAFTFNTGCEKADLQKTSLEAEASVTLRTDDCTDCPFNDCCCGIELLSPNNFLFLTFCGTSGARISSQVCEATPPDPCPPIEGFVFGPINLTDMDPKQAFCMNPGDAFVISVSGTGSASFRITCQDDQGNPQSVTLILAAGNRYYFDTNGNCEVDECT